jgi:hypothetical protein
MTTAAGRTLVALAALLSAACEKEAPAPAPFAAPAPLPAEPAAAPAPPKVTTAEEIVVPEVKLSDAELDVAKGRELFSDKGCRTCHAAIGGVKALGPDLKGVLARRSLVYVQRMMMRPDIMIRTDPTAKALFAQYSVPMTNQRIDPVKEMPFLLDYLKSLDK